MLSCPSTNTACGTVKGGRPSNLLDLYPLSFSLTRFVYIAASYCMAIHPAHHGNVRPDPMWRSASSLIVPSRLVASPSEVFFFSALTQTRLEWKPWPPTWRGHPVLDPSSTPYPAPENERKTKSRKARGLSFLSRRVRSGGIAY